MTPVTVRVLPGEIACLVLQHGKANAIDEALLASLNDALEQSVGARGLVITGNGRFFCPGLDLTFVLPLSREQMAEFMERFISTLRRVLTWPGPTAAAINGHALGGGFLLALACDRRFAVADDRIRIGFPDVERQVPLSHSLRLLALHALPFGEATLVDGQATNYTPAEAARRGIVELVEGSDPVESAVAWIVRQPPDYAMEKSQRLAPLLAQLDALGPEDIEHFLDQWFAPETREAFEHLGQRMQAKEKGRDEHHVAG